MKPILAYPADTRQDGGAPKIRDRRRGRKRHGFRPNGAGARRGSGTSTLAGLERVARNQLRAELRAAQLQARTA